MDRDEGSDEAANVCVCDRWTGRMVVERDRQKQEQGQEGKGAEGIKAHLCSAARVLQK